MRRHISRLGDEDQPDDVREAAALAILVLCEDAADLVREGGIEPLVALLDQSSSASDAARGAAAMALARAAAKTAARQAVAEAGGIEALVAFLGADSTGAGAAAEALMYLAKDHKDAIAEAGGIEKLVGVASDGATTNAKRFAAGALRNLTCHNAANKAAIVSAGGVPVLLRLVAETAETAEEAAGALANIARRDNATRLAVADAGAARVLVSAAASGARTPASRAMAAETLAVIACAEKSKTQIALAGGADALLELLALDDARTQAATALRNLTCGPRHPRVLGLVRPGIPALVGVLAPDTEDCAKEAAIATLIHLAIEDAATAHLVVEAGAVAALLRVLEEQHAPLNGAAVEATALLRTLAFYPEHRASVGAAMPLLVGLADEQRARPLELALAALANILADHQPNQLRFQQIPGAVPLLLKLAGGAAATPLAIQHARGALKNLLASSFGGVDLPTGDGIDLPTGDGIDLPTGDGIDSHIIPSKLPEHWSYSSFTAS
ncbi:hypothetical protein CTAYLR_003083 [Chrysophaeum taylorii]|uniref:Uncharacterized protein n=1 Tax=Chrysophaeum taylorii TaxID=2483200 RepID=A0AAD7U5H5_9STRA|nr:hypothetical protein CTAYLR_003083 [Chrysophaeum taylorii]